MADIPAMADKVLTSRSKAFNLAEVWEWRPDGTNPCRHVGRACGRQPASRAR
ncbi:MAG: hypothetical protein MI919_38605 [Holophagales bacterium]|nr:hypothetical protein [Holophagales bacterium]